MTAAPRPAESASEAALAAAWAAGPRGPLRLEVGRRLRIIFPGVPGPGMGPDFCGAILDVDGDILRGDVEIHLRASGWRQHGHAHDPAYRGVVLHAVGRNDGGAAFTGHGGRTIPILVLPAADAFPPPFTPPCALSVAQGLPAGERLEVISLRRLRMKAARQAALAAAGPGPALYAAIMETCGGPSNRHAFATIARLLPLPALLERLPAGSGRALAAAAHLKESAAGVIVRRAGLRPMASPARRLETAGRLISRLWPGPEPRWPLEPGAPLLAALRVEGAGRGLAIELAINAVLPVALASGAWPADVVEAAWRSLPSPGTYGLLRPLERWLGAGGARPFTTAARLQGGLLLHADYCTAGRCGRCPLSG